METVKLKPALRTALLWLYRLVLIAYLFSLDQGLLNRWTEHYKSANTELRGT